MLKMGEMVLKGLNRARFEQRLLAVIKKRLAPIGAFTVESMQSAVYVTPEGDVSEGVMDAALAAMRRVFGLAAVTAAYKTLADMDAMLDAALRLDALKNAKTFKAEARRAVKTFPLTSPQICAKLGEMILDKLPHLSVDVHNPDVTVWVEIREGFAYVHPSSLPGAGGLPSGMGGKAALLLSGGIDSPVAGWRMARRGLELTGVHFESYPFTSPQALEKVFTLAGLLAKWHGEFALFAVPFTEIQKRMRAECPEDYFTILMRRSMYRVTGQIAARHGLSAVVTGESLGQVASQTLESMAVTGQACALPVLRPLVGMDKEEIVTLAREIGTFETSILPYEDCCTVFTPRHPKTKPRLEPVLDAERRGTWKELEQQAAQAAERRVFL
jgi:thiamine biosynthesis protein ThiI